MGHGPGLRSEPGDPWRLTEDDLALAAAKPRRSRLEFAVLLLFFRAHGRFPRPGMEAASTSIARIARQFGAVPPASSRRTTPARTLKRYRAEIRAHFGTRQATVRDADDLIGWLRDHAVATTRDFGDLASRLEAQCRMLGLEPPSPSRARRIARSAVRAYDDQACARVRGSLSSITRARLDALLRPSRATPAAAPIVWLRGDPGRPSLNSLRVRRQSS